MGKNIKTGHALIERGKRGKSIIVNISGTRRGIVSSSQSVINRNPKKKYRYVKIVVDKTLPWFRKGE